MATAVPPADASGEIMPTRREGFKITRILIFSMTFLIVGALILIFQPTTN